MRHSRGAVLILALTLLMALSALTLAAYQGAGFQQLLVAGERDQQAALETAEATLAAARDQLMAETRRPATCDDGSCGVYAAGELPLTPAGDWKVADATWWKNNGVAAGGGRYVMEYAGFVPDDLTTGRGARKGRDFYRILARATGDRPGTRVLLEAVYARRFTD